MKRDRQGVLQHIGRTPLVPLERIARGLPVRVLVKCEHLNPGGSIERITMAPVSPAIDFSFDYQDLLFTPVSGESGERGKR